MKVKKINMNKPHLVIISLLIVVAVALSWALVECRQTVTNLSEQITPEGETKVTEYPNNLIEGTITSINLGEPVTLTIAADISKIVAGAGVIEKDIQLGSNTKVVVYDIGTKEEREIELSDLKPDDFILVATQEPTQGKVVKQKTFTALKITKMVGTSKL